VPGNNPQWTEVAGRTTSSSRGQAVMTWATFWKSLNLTMVCRPVRGRAKIIPDNETEAVLLKYLSAEPGPRGRAWGAPPACRSAR